MVPRERDQDCRSGSGRIPKILPDPDLLKIMILDPILFWLKNLDIYVSKIKNSDPDPQPWFM